MAAGRSQAPRTPRAGQGRVARGAGAEERDPVGRAGEDPEPRSGDGGRDAHDPDVLPHGFTRLPSRVFLPDGWTSKSMRDMTAPSLQDCDIDAQYLSRNVCAIDAGVAVSGIT